MATAMAIMARGRLPLLLSLAMAMVDMATAGMDTTATMARERLRQLLLLSQKLLPSLATDTTAMVAMEAMAMADMVTTATMARGPLMPTTATEDTEDMVMDTAMDMVTAMATTARDLRMHTTATEDTEDMVLATAVDTPLDTLDSATPVVTTASVRPRLSPRLMPMLRLIPTTDTVTPALAMLVPSPPLPSTPPLLPPWLPPGPSLPLLWLPLPWLLPPLPSPEPTLPLPPLPPLPSAATAPPLLLVPTSPEPTLPLPPPP